MVREYRREEEGELWGRMIKRGGMIMKQELRINNQLNTLNLLLLSYLFTITRAIIKAKPASTAKRTYFIKNYGKN